MTVKVAINGFGRIGRLVLRAIIESKRNDISVVAINDLLDIKHLAYLLKYDSVHGKCKADVLSDDNSLIVDGKKIQISSERDPKKIAWDLKGVDVVLECTGIFTTLETAQLHIDGGAPKVVISAHVISGLLAAIAGMLVVCRLQLGTPNIGDSWLLPSFAAPVIGGAILAGGKVDVIATALGVLIVAIISQALVIFKIDPFFVQIFLGLMILLAVFVNRYREYKQEVSRKIFNIE